MALFEYRQRSGYLYPKGDVMVALQVVTYQLDESTLVRFEIEPPPGFQPAGGAAIAGRVKEAIAPAIETAQLVLDRAKALAPEEIEVKFGLKVSGKVDWIVARAASEGNFEIKLTWKPRGDQSTPDRVQPEGTKTDVK
jgi:Trypsin-co-occurring domain 1